MAASIAGYTESYIFARDDYDPKTGYDFNSLGAGIELTLARDFVIPNCNRMSIRTGKRCGFTTKDGFCGNLKAELWSGDEIIARKRVYCGDKTDNE